MDCPRCTSAPLVEIDRDGITLDRCDGCRGIWLDRGELEKLLARGKDSERVQQPSRDADADDDGDDDRGGRNGQRKRSFWEIFD